MSEAVAKLKLLFNRIIDSGQQDGLVVDRDTVRRILSQAALASSVSSLAWLKCVFSQIEPYFESIVA